VVCRQLRCGMIHDRVRDMPVLSAARCKGHRAMGPWGHGAMGPWGHGATGPRHCWRVPGRPWQMLFTATVPARPRSAPAEHPWARLGQTTEVDPWRHFSQRRGDTAVPGNSAGAQSDNPLISSDCGLR
jgi:hypothetical protein